MTISDQIAELEARDREHEKQIAELKRRLEKQTGALLESRGQNSELIKKLAEASELIGTYQTHFHTFHGSAEHIKSQERELAQAGAAAAVATMVPPETLSGRIAKLVRRNGEAA